MGFPVVHFEIWGLDGVALQNFYAATFGWKVDANNPTGYGLVDTNAADTGINGGLMATAPGMPPSGTAIYIAVPDINAMLAQIEYAGGRTIMPRTEVMGSAVIGMFADPQGNVVGLYEGMMAAEQAAEKKVPEKAAKKKVARKAANSAPARKVAAKKVAAKKVAAKKAPAKKVAAKKVAAKKVAAKKAPAQKVAAKKTASKKAAKKKAGQRALARVAS